jgi:hypothetical protein
VTDLAAQATAIVDEWRRRHADCALEAFAQVVATRGAALAAGLGHAAEADRVVDAYLRLIAEALQLGYLDRATCAHLEAGPAPPTNLLARCLLDVVPRWLPTCAADRRLGVLAQVWNLGDGLLRQPPWMARIANALLPDVEDLEHLGQALAEKLEPLLSPPRSSSFAGPFALQMLDLREVDDEFLPGVMHAAAPAVICVHDRVRPGRYGAVALALRGGCRTLGTTPCLSDDLAPETRDPIEVQIGRGRARILGRDVELAAVEVEHAHLALASGFVVVSAVDSQRLWIVESAS